MQGNILEGETLERRCGDGRNFRTGHQSQFRQLQIKEFSYKHHKKFSEPVYVRYRRKRPEEERVEEVRHKLQEKTQMSANWRSGRQITASRQSLQQKNKDPHRDNGEGNGTQPSVIKSNLTNEYITCMQSVVVELEILCN